MVANLFGPDLGIVVLVLIVVLLGGSQLPKIARNVGTAGREFRKAQQEAEEEAEREKAAKAAREAISGSVAAAPIAPAPVQPAPAQPPAEATSRPGSVTLTPEELEALLKAREEQVRRGEPAGG
ncbi:MAG TPA: twin-arginine translocase TatA/TatE family subunit [Acidimicrobiales bacterium]|nr:twin-arginine translocase TatA/TatE family subunit [Acidimicrobiales bacterium]